MGPAAHPQHVVVREFASHKVPTTRRKSEQAGRSRLHRFFLDFRVSFSTLGSYLSDMTEDIAPDDISQALVLEAQQGDRGSFDRLVSRYETRLRGLVEARLGESLRTKLDVNDVIQETLLRAFRSLDRFAWEGDESLFRWLTTIVLNVIRENARRERRSWIVPLDVEPPSHDPTSSHATAREERFERLREAVDQLSSDHRQAILLARIERLPIREVAERMNRTPDAVSQLLRRALSKLREALPEGSGFSLPPRSLLEDSPTAPHRDES